METVGIIGTGIMGTDIAHIAADSGYRVVLHDLYREKMESSIDKIRDRLDRYVSSGKISGNKREEILSRITPVETIDGVSSVDIVIECVIENVYVKKEVFKNLDEVCRPATILASNTSSISITEIASATNRPDSVIGIHFLIPAHIMNLVEIIPGLTTTRETVEMAKTFVKDLGKIMVESKDFPGFLLNRMLFPMINEAIYLLYEGAGTVETIDQVIKAGLNMPMGPLTLADLIGLDVVLAVSEEMYRDYSDTKYRPCPLLKKYVSAGYMGKKSGRGFYIY